MATGSEGLKTRVILVGVGGATCSGKTTLAKHLRGILPDSFLIHQDDFAPPEEKVPVHPVYNVQDWDAPEGAIEWPRLIKFLHDVKETGDIPADHYSHDHLNEQREVALDKAIVEKYRKEFTRIQEESKSRNEQIKWGLVDGFLLYWHPEVVALLDACIFLRVPYDVLKKRRDDRSGYHTAVESDPEGTFWRDPPNYWEQIVWPAYVQAHKDLFVNGDLEHGKIDEAFKGERLTLIDGIDLSMGDTVTRCCESLKDALLND